MKNKFLLYIICASMGMTSVAFADNYPLHTAVKLGQPKRVRAEMSWYRVNQRDGADMTPLMYAAMKDRSTSARILLQNGARVNEQTYKYGTTALMMAAMNGYHEVVDVLLQYGASIDLGNSNGFTALMLAAWKGQARTVRQLLRAGANPRLRDNTGGTALNHASTEEVCIILEKATGMKRPRNKQFSTPSKPTYTPPPSYTPTPSYTPSPSYTPPPTVPTSMNSMGDWVDYHKRTVSSNDLSFMNDAYESYVTNIQTGEVKSLNDLKGDRYDYVYQWPNREFEVIDYRVSGKIIEIRSSFKCTSVAGEVSRGYTKTTYHISPNNRIQAYRYDISTIAPPPFSGN